MKKSNLTLYVLTLVTTGAVAWAYYTPIDISVEAGGMVRPEDGVVHVVAEVGGRITRAHGREGMTIHQGDVLVQLDTREGRLKQRALESRIHTTEIRIQQLRDNLRAAADVEKRSLTLDSQQDSSAQQLSELGLEQSRHRFDQTGLLFREGLISRQAYEDAHSSMERAEAELAKWTPDTHEVRKAQSQARLNDRKADIDSVRADLTNLYHQLEQVSLDIARLTISSPAAGEIAAMNPLHPGEILTPGSPIAAIIPSDPGLVIETWLQAGERRWVKEGQLVRVQPEERLADQSNTFDGSVLSISPDVKVTDSLAAYRVLVTPAAFSPPLRSGMIFRIHFITRQERLLWLLFHRLLPS